MGCCCVAGANEKDIHFTVKQHNDESPPRIKVGFLGTHGSGKTTFCKQLQNIHGNGFNEDDMNTYKRVIYIQIIEQMQLLVKSMRYLIDNDVEHFGDAKLSDESDKCVQYVMNIKLDYRMDNMDAVVADKIEILWNDPVIQKVFKRRHEFDIEDSSKYFFDDIKRFTDTGFRPTDEDIIMARNHRELVVNQHFTIKQDLFFVLDFGSDMNETYKWMHRYEDAQGIIFVASLSSYNEITYEDSNRTNPINKMHQSLEFFQTICNKIAFRDNIIMTLFLNKTDLFKQKLPEYPLSICFPEYTGNNTYDECVQFIQQQYEAKFTKKWNTMTTHLTCGIQRDNLDDIWKDIHEWIRRANLKQAGFMDFAGEKKSKMETQKSMKEMHTK